MRSTLHSPVMNFPQLFNPTRLVNYVNHRLDHPVLQVPSGAPTYALSTSDEGVLLTRDGGKIGITEVPGISGWLVQRFDYWEKAFNHALETFYDTEPDTYGLEAYGVSIAADLADLLVNKAHVTYCGMGIHCEYTLAKYLRDHGERVYEKKVHESGKVEYSCHYKLKAGFVALGADASLTRWMQMMEDAGKTQSNGPLDATFFAYFVYYDAFGCNIEPSSMKDRHRKFKTCVPDQLWDFYKNRLYLYEGFSYEEIPQWSEHSWLFSLREDASLIDLARHFNYTGGIARKYGKHRIMRPLASS